MKILICDDEKGFAEVLQDNLKFEKYKSDCVYSGKQAMEYLRKKKVDLVLMDVMLPDIDGFEVIKRLRNENRKTPVIFLTARAQENDKLKGLGLGDDYLTKPFSVMELIARIKALMRRIEPGSELNRIKIGDVSVDFNKFCFTKGKKEGKLSRYEVKILRLLSSEPGKIFPRQDILEKIWGAGVFISDRTIDNYIVKLRQKIEADPRNPEFLITEYGEGYVLKGIKIL